MLKRYNFVTLIVNVLVNYFNQNFIEHRYWKKYKIQLASWDLICLGLKSNGCKTLHFGRTIICSFFAYIFACFQYFGFFD